MKKNTFFTVIVSFIFLFVVSTADLSSAETIKKTQQKIEKSALDFSLNSNSVHMELMKHDLIINDNDGGGKISDNTFIWLILIGCVVLMVILIILIVEGGSAPVY